MKNSFIFALAINFSVGLCHELGGVLITLFLLSQLIWEGEEGDQDYYNEWIKLSIVTLYHDKTIGRCCSLCIFWTFLWSYIQSSPEVSCNWFKDWWCKSRWTFWILTACNTCHTQCGVADYLQLRYWFMDDIRAV